MRGAEADEVIPRRGQRHERIGRRGRANPRSASRILGMRTSSRSAAPGSSDTRVERRGGEEPAEVGSRYPRGKAAVDEKAHGCHRHETRPEGLEAE